MWMWERELFFIDGANVQKMRQFSERIVNYVAQFQEYILDSVQNTVAPCRPVWNVFQGVRQLLCRHLVDPLVSSPGGKVTPGKLNVVWFFPERAVVLHDVVHGAVPGRNTHECQVDRLFWQDAKFQPPLPRTNRVIFIIDLTVWIILKYVSYLLLRSHESSPPGPSWTSPE